MHNFGPTNLLHDRHFVHIYIQIICYGV